MRRRPLFSLKLALLRFPKHHRHHLTYLMVLFYHSISLISPLYLKQDFKTVLSFSFIALPKQEFVRRCCKEFKERS